MTESLCLSLQAFPSVDKDKQSLQYLISRINDQKGSFRNVTEESLEEEIQVLNTGETGNGQDEGLETVDGPEDLKSKKEEISTARKEILQQIGQAWSESTMALDFVSLLLSKHAPASAQSTMSQYLKDNLKVGVLDGEVVQTPQSSDLEQRNQEMVSIGWRMQSLNNAADSLLESASRLEDEVGRETTYWNQVLAVKESGWSLSRLPRERHTLGVRYGFAEAYADFRDRGLAALRRDEDGNLSLDRGFRSRGSRQLRVRVLQQGKPIASNTKAMKDNFEDESVVTEILNARDSIFDEELHHEIHREARNLVNQGIRCVGTSVLIPYETDKQIELDLISPEHSISEDVNGSNLVVDNVATSLRILLSYAHRQSLRSRSQTPPPIRESKKPRPLYALLKPVIEYFQHQLHLQSLQRFLEQIHKTLAAAGLDFAVETTSTSQNFAVANSVAKKLDTPTIENLLQQLTSPPHSTMTLQLAGGSTIVTIDVHTALHPPTLGTSCQVVNKDFPSTSPIAELPQTTQFPSLAALESHVMHVTTLLILQHLLSRFNTWRSFSAHSNSIMRNRLRSKDREMVSVVLGKGQLNLDWQRNGRLNEQGTWTWHDRGAEGDGEKRALVDIFKTF